MGYNYFENHDCEFYPCHNMEHLNCLFCFCPLYPDMECGGNFSIIEGKNGDPVKDCSNCTIPHSKECYDYIINKLNNGPKRDEQNESE